MDRCMLAEPEVTFWVEYTDWCMLAEAGATAWAEDIGWCMLVELEISGWAKAMGWYMPADPEVTAWVEDMVHYFLHVVFPPLYNQIIVIFLLIKIIKTPTTINNDGTKKKKRKVREISTAMVKAKPDRRHRLYSIRVTASFPIKRPEGPVLCRALPACPDNETVE
ncbi:hypothetical protein NDU88_008425 [Pleurodeles waltl]|uniref:Uncharacterized protein n=1 Tax=Pleurodeles waltl TaxID=8319 RepID=A0AAV7N4Z4_PLEWA|nr:hypothetical protein NDU88_008425 [Pleurodeles waltl]